jgi:prepilin-type N-terminal cleavage/methylation domain-containing protein
MHQQAYRNSPGPQGFSLVEIMISVMVLAVAVSAVLGSIVNLSSLRKDSGDVQKAQQAATYMVQVLQGTNWDDLNDQSKPETYLTWARWPDFDGTGTIDDDANCLIGSLDPAPGAGNRCLPFLTGLDDLRIYLEYYRAVTAADENGITLRNGANYCFSGLLEGSLVRTPDAAGEIWTIDPTAGPPSRPQNLLSGLALVERVGSDLAPHIPSIGITSVDASGDGAADPIEPIRLPWNAAIRTLSGVTIGAEDPVVARIMVTWKDRSLAAPEPPKHAARRQFVLITGLKR